MVRFHEIVVTWFLLAVMVLPCRRAAADEIQDKAAAEALFQLAQSQMAEGKYAEACPKFEASHKLDPGVGTLLFLGECQEKLGKFASAWATFQEASALAKSRAEPDRERVADIRAAALRPRLSYVTFEVNPGNKMGGFELRRRGLTVAPASWGVRLPTDPGSYEIEASAPGFATWKTTVTVQPDVGTPIVVQVPALSALGANAAPPPSVPAGSGSAPDGSQPGGGTQKTWGAVLATAGVAVAVASGVFTVLAARKNNESIGNCSKQDQNLCKPVGVDERSQAKKFANVATVLGIGGGVLFASGATLYLTAPRDERGKLAGFTLSVQGAF